MQQITIQLNTQSPTSLTWNSDSKSALRILPYTIIDLPFDLLFDLHPWALLQTQKNSKMKINQC